MMTVNSHAAPTPTMSTHNSHDWLVGSGSLACQRSKAKAARIDTAHCATSIRMREI
jgi:hypothetical protein